MKGATYLLRFDDLCPTMNWAIWDRVEAALVERGIRPLLAIVPDNRDPVLQMDVPRTDFWDRVRAWQSRGWAIGMHGYQHTYVTKSSGIIGLNPTSEFAGLPLQEQRAKLELAMAVFDREGVRPDVWVAPGHSFDRKTVQAVRDIGIRIISDGLSSRAYSDGDGMVWIPQQLWRLRRIPTGVWTVCCHHNAWDSTRLATFLQSLDAYRDRIGDVATVVEQGKRHEPTPVDRFLPKILLPLIRGRRRLRRAVSR
jgi:predicted deacetylase